MPRSDVEADFPSLVGLQFELSDEDFNFNCLAYALGDCQNWWEPPKGKGQYWPDGFPADLTVETVESIFRMHGFTIETEDPYDPPQTDAIAIYAEGTEWTHFAKFQNGVWSSKLGEGHDVTGVPIQRLEGELYGRVVKTLRRPLRDPMV